MLFGTTSHMFPAGIPYEIQSRKPASKIEK